MVLYLYVYFQYDELIFSLCVFYFVCHVGPGAANHSAVSTSASANYLNLNTAVGTYYIGVHTNATKDAVTAAAADFTVLATVLCPDSNVTAVMLTESSPQAGYVATGAWAYYKLYVPATNANRSVVIAITASSGDPDLFVKTDKDADTGDAAPTAGNARWFSMAHGRDVVVIAPSDAHYCTDCSYQIAVEGYLESVYLITASSSATYTPLSPSLPLEGIVDRDEVQYYTARPPAGYTDDLAFILTNLGSGDPDISIRTSPFDPAQSPQQQAQWRGEATGSDQVIIAADDADRCVNTGLSDDSCAYFIAITGYRATAYSLLFAVDLPIMLSDGAAQSASLAANKTRAFIVKIPDPAAQRAVFSVQALGGRLEAYFARDALPDPADDKTYESAQVGADASKGYTFEVTVPADAPKCADAGDCYYLVLVKGVSDTWFTVTASIQVRYPDPPIYDHKARNNSYILIDMFYFHTLFCILLYYATFIVFRHHLCNVFSCFYFC